MQSNEEQHQLQRLTTITNKEHQQEKPHYQQQPTARYTTPKTCRTEYITDKLN
jgi:hypothetical protein